MSVPPFEFDPSQVVRGARPSIIPGVPDTVPVGHKINHNLSAYASSNPIHL